MRMTAADMLSELGYSVLEARDADAALAIIEGGIAIDVLFTDVVMPGKFQSSELARRAKQRLPNIAVLFTSGYAKNAILHGGRLDEGLQVLTALWTGTEVRHHGRYHDIDGLRAIGTALAAG